MYQQIAKKILKFNQILFHPGILKIRKKQYKICHRSQLFHDRKNRLPTRDVFNQMTLYVMTFSNSPAVMSMFSGGCMWDRAESADPTAQRLLPTTPGPTASGAPAHDSSSDLKRRSFFDDLHCYFLFPSSSLYALIWAFY